METLLARLDDVAAALRHVNGDIGPDEDPWTEEEVWAGVRWAESEVRAILTDYRRED